MTDKKVSAAMKKYLAQIGKRGGDTRMSNLSAERRKEIAAAAAAKRWEGHTKRVRKAKPTDATTNQ